MSIFERMAEGAGIGATTGIAKDIKYLLGISGAGIDADSQVEKPMRLQVKE